MFQNFPFIKIGGGLDLSYTVLFANSESNVSFLTYTSIISNVLGIRNFKLDFCLAYRKIITLIICRKK